MTTRSLQEMRADGFDEEDILVVNVEAEARLGEAEPSTT